MTDQNIEQLTSQYKNKSWFHDVGTDSFGRYVVYVNQMNQETLHDIPDYIAGKQVVVHFAYSKNASREQFTHQVGAIYNFPIIEPEEELTTLQRSLDQLELICGSHNLQDIFFEIHDRRNALTNISTKYPQVREALEILYDQYGFDILYEQFEQFETLPEYSEE